jgi:hypothetical protein
MLMGKQLKRGSDSAKKQWVTPGLKIISANSAEADVGGAIKDGANVSAKS